MWCYDKFQIPTESKCLIGWWWERQNGKKTFLNNTEATIRDYSAL